MLTNKPSDYVKTLENRSEDDYMQPVLSANLTKSNQSVPVVGKQLATMKFLQFLWGQTKVGKIFLYFFILKSSLR